jgi:hypothetical protein
MNKTITARIIRLEYVENNDDNLSARWFESQYRAKSIHVYRRWVAAPAAWTFMTLTRTGHFSLYANSAKVYTASFWFAFSDGAPELHVQFDYDHGKLTYRAYRAVPSSEDVTPVPDNREELADTVVSGYAEIRRTNVSWAFLSDKRLNLTVGHSIAVIHEIANLQIWDFESLSNMPFSDDDRLRQGLEPLYLPKDIGALGLVYNRVGFYMSHQARYFTPELEAYGENSRAESDNFVKRIYQNSAGYWLFEGENGRSYTLDKLPKQASWFLFYRMWSRITDQTTNIFIF